MFLTRLRLDPRNAQARRDLGDPYEMHRTLTRAFVPDAEQPAPRFLWRAEPTAAWSEPVVLVQSSFAANWAALAELPNYFKHPPETKILPDELQQAGCYRFRLFANPTVSRDRKRVGLVSEDAQLAWLARQGERMGFVLDAALVTDSETIRSRKGTGHITLLKVCFEGRLRVSEPHLLAEALKAGIGPGKAFGCGMLSLARIG